MTRQEFERRAIIAAEKDAGLPPGWFGTWTHAQNGNGIEVKAVRPGKDFLYQHWIVRVDGKIVSKHDSREFAFKKARRLERGGRL